MLRYLFLLYASVSGAVIGIDLGSELFKVINIQVSLIRPGKRLIIVENEQSKRSTPFAISFTDQGREYGYNALREQVKRPDSTLLFTHNIFGNPSSSNLNRTFQPLEYSKNTERNSLFINIKQETLEIEEIVAMILEHIKDMSEKFAESSVKDCAITVPSFWNRGQRIELISAAQAAGLNVLSLINENTAAALYYGIDRLDNETDHFVLFYNLGASYLQTTLAKYSSANKNISSKSSKVIENIEILAQSSDETLGGSTFDSVLAYYLAQKFETIHNLSVVNVPKAMIRLFQQANLAKKVLSANKFTLVIANNLYQNIDFKYTLTREEFENLVLPYEERLITPLLSVLKTGQISLSQINFLEIIGGVSRVPIIQEIIKKRTGLEISTHLNGDEAMAHGTAFFAANFSSEVQIKPIWLSDTFDSEIAVKIFEADSENLIYQHVVFDKTWKVGNFVELNLNTSKNLKIQLADVTDEQNKTLGVYEINDIEKIEVSNHTLNFIFVLDFSGIPFLYESYAAYDVPVKKIKKNKNIKNFNKTDTENTTETNEEPLKTEKIENETEKKTLNTQEINEKQLQDEWTLERKVIKLRHNYTDLDNPRILTSSEISSIRTKLAYYKSKEKQAKELAEMKNELESYIYYLSDKIEESSFVSVTSSEQREEISDLISSIKS